jgi:hypothetical protein
MHTSAREASDWYSVGVMLYEALTGTLPFAGDWLDVIIEKQDRDPVSPIRVTIDTPQDLSDLCMDLLRREPDLRPTAAEIRTRLKADEQAFPDARMVAAAPVVDGVALIARTVQLETLRQMLDAVVGGKSAAVHVTGPSGVGKTSLVRHFVTEARMLHPSAAILTGACHQQESVTFNALDELVDRLTDYLEHLPPPELAFVLPPRSAIIGRVFPVFRRVTDGIGQTAESTLVDPVEIRRQALGAVRTLLGRLCERTTVIVVIDDVQWGDRDSGSFLRELLRPPDAPPLLLILSYRRTADDGHAAVVDGIGGAASEDVCRVDIDLADLSPADAEALARQLLERQLPAIGGDEIKRIAVEAGGSPFMIHRLARHVLASPHRLGAIASRSVIAEEMDRLMRVDRRLVELIAVAGRPLPVDVAVQAATRDVAARIDLGVLCAARMLQMWRRGNEEWLDLYHDQIRRHILDALVGDARTSCHRALIDAFEAIRPQDSERLAYHCEQAARPGAAATHALVAADKASRALAFDKAVTLYRRALELGDWDSPGRHVIHTALATALANAGRGLEAAKAFLAAAEGANGIGRVRLRIKAADQYLRTGHLSEGQALLKVLLDEVGLSSNDRLWIVIASMLFHRARATALLRRIDDDRERADDEQLTARMEVLWAAAVGLGMFDPIRSAEFAARHLVLALQSGDVYRIALGLAGEATQYAHRDGGRDGRPQELLQAAWRYARRSGEPHALAFVHCMTATVAFLGGRWSESLAESTTALELLREKCTGVSWETATATLFMGASRVILGDMTELARVLPVFVADARARGDVYAAEVMPALTMSWIQHLVSDDPATASKALPALPARDALIRWRIVDTNALCGRVQVAVYRGAPEHGWALLEEYWSSLTRSPMFRVITIRTLMSMSRGGCALSLAASDQTSATDRASLLRTAEETARSMAATRCGWAGALALAMRAGIASCQGKSVEAAQLLDRAASDLQAFELMPWYYSARWQRASVEEHKTGRIVPLESWWVREQILRPQRIASLLIPGAWPARTAHHAQETVR